MTNKQYGKKQWALSDGYIPLQSTGREPDFVSSDKVSILNTSFDEATITIILYFMDGEPAGDYKFKVKPERVRKVRINDLIDPHAIPLGVSYAGVIESDVPVVVQFTKQNSAQKELAIMGTKAYPAD
ncbi:sensory rhodopsin transducer [Pontibacter diazotrophicus]|uniref:Sensory rhodopsin transducer n=1 Tax=Pontibacter diazotrophicus TaxID=1400979 RepID=A0A3D8L020_9BACT|nr:sensory rhodopsin transducer [Pontibacter diazotrophicus]RDV10726.1 sensory rhodopsin transducer [Pontibacter diazotrophicus]